MNSITKLVLLMVAFLVLSSCSKNESTQDSGTDEQLEISCKEPLPVFTLGEGDRLTKNEQEELCSCVWESLSVSDRGFIRTIKSAPADKVQKWSYRFGDAIRKCEK